jgi:hydrogenase maturation protease
MLTIIGCGNPNRSDDGAGVAAIARLRSQLGTDVPRVRLLDAGTSGMEVMFQARGSRALVIIDACTSGAEPGAIFRVPGAELANVPDPGQGLHAFRWDHALYAGNRLFSRDFPAHVSVYLIEAETLALGLDLSARVSAAVDRVVQLLLERVFSTVCIKNGSFYLSAGLYEKYFHGQDCVAALARAGNVALLPLRTEGSGGLLVKHLNARGDRVIHAPELLRQLGVPESAEFTVEARWDAEFGALVWPSLNAGMESALSGFDGDGR